MSDTCWAALCRPCLYARWAQVDCVPLMLVIGYGQPVSEFTPGRGKPRVTFMHKWDVLSGGKTHVCHYCGLGYEFWAMRNSTREPLKLLHTNICYARCWRLAPRNNLEIDDPCSITKSLEEIFGERMFDHAVVWPRNYVRRCRISCQKGLRSIHQVEVILHVVALPKLRSPSNWNYMMMFNHANSHATPFIGNHGLMMIMNMSMLTWDEEYCARVYKMLYAHSAC